MAQYTTLTDEDVRQIVAAYALDVADFEPLTGGAANSSFLLHAGSGPCVLTLFEEHTHPQIQALADLLRTLVARGFPTNPVYRTAQDQAVTNWNGKPVLVKAFLTGEVRQPQGSLLTDIGVHLARLHALPAPPGLATEHRYGLQAFTQVIGGLVLPEFEDWLAGQREYFEGNLPEDTPRGLIHGDLFYDNVLSCDGRLVAIVDFEEACNERLVFDLAMAIVGNCCPGGELSLPRARALLAGYQEHRRLEPGERASLRLFIEYAATATAFWRFWKYHIDSRDPAKCDLHREMVGLAEAVRELPEKRFQLLHLQ